MGGLSNMALWLRIPLTPQPAAAAAEPGCEQEAGADGAAAAPAAGAAAAGVAVGAAPDPWEWWSQLRFLAHHSPRLGVVLELGPDLPAPEDLARWRGEPVK